MVDLLKESLKFNLYLIKTPRKRLSETKDLQKEEKEWLSKMENFYSSLTGLKKKGIFGTQPWVCFELTKVKDEILIYAAFPKEHDEFLQKQIFSFFPEISIEKAKDYNIFAPEEITACGYFKPKKHFYLPLRTFLSIETPPLMTICHALTKLSSEEEASVQVLIRNTSQSWHYSARKVIEKMQKGKTFEQALSESSFLGEFLRAGKTEEKESFKEARVIEEEVLKGIKEKTEKDSFEVNLRVVVSVPEKEKAKKVLVQIVNAFEIFSLPKLNALNFIEARGKREKDLISKYSFRLFDKNQAFILSSVELTSLFHFPTPWMQVPKLKFLEAKSAPPPSNLPKEGLLLGYTEYRGEKVDAYIKKDDRRRHIYIIGQTGTGKSSFLSNLISQDIEKGDGVAVLDPHGDLIEDILGKIPERRLDDVVLFDPGNLERAIGLNFLEYDPKRPEQKTFIVNELIQIFDKLYDLRQTGGPMFEQYARNALLLLMDDPYEKFTLMEVPKILSDKDFRSYLLSKCRNIVVKEFWEKEAEKAGGEAALQNMVPYITSKFNVFIANDYMRPIIGQKETGLDFREIMEKRKILLCNLSKGRLGEQNSALLGLILTGKITMSAFARIELPQQERKDFYLYMDEFQNFCTQSISTILAEARKYRLSLTIAHQFIGQLPEPIKKAIFGNVGTIISFRVGPEDAEFLKKEFEPVFSVEDLISLDNFNFYCKLIIDGVVSRPFNVKTYPPSKPDSSWAKKVKEYSLKRYGRPTIIVEKEIQERFFKRSAKY